MIGAKLNFKKLSDSSLYFIAIIPPDPLSAKLIELKNQVASGYGSKASLRSPPHITLHMPFGWPHKKFERLATTLTSFFYRSKPYILKLSGFGSFAPKVIFVKVEPDPRLSTMQSDLCRLMAEKLSIYNANYRNKPFHPHITIAFRDLKKSSFFEAWEYYSSQLFQEELCVNQVTLLKHNGRFWEQVLHFQVGI